MTAQRLLDQLQQESQAIIQQVRDQLLSLDEKMLRPIVVSPVSEKDPIATWWTGDV